GEREHRAERAARERLRRDELADDREHPGRDPDRDEPRREEEAAGNRGEAEAARGRSHRRLARHEPPAFFARPVWKSNASAESALISACATVKHDSTACSASLASPSATASMIGRL